MGSLMSTPVMWFVIGFVLFLAEFIIPGLILVFFGVGAWLIALITLFADISLTAQLAVFLSASIISVALLRNLLKRNLYNRNGTESLLEDEFIGKTGIAETAILPGIKGKVAFKGTSWEATSEDSIAPGENVIITAYQSILLIVKSNKKI